ncbi:MAG: hypothetical protein Q9205_003170 [Flavoplaca limonia]
MVPFDRSRLDRARYNLVDGQDVSEFEKTVQEFVNLARRDELAHDQTLIDDFCALVEREMAWRHAQITSEDPRVGEQMNGLLARLDPLLRRLPTRDVLASEQDLLAQRCRNWFTCATKVTEGHFRDESYGSDIQGFVEDQEALTRRVRPMTASSVGSVKRSQDRSDNRKPPASKITTNQVKGKSAANQVKLMENFVGPQDTQGQPGRPPGKQPNDSDDDSEPRKQQRRKRPAAPKDQVKGKVAPKKGGALDKFLISRDSHGSTYQPSQKEPDDDSEPAGPQRLTRLAASKSAISTEQAGH